MVISQGQPVSWLARDNVSLDLRNEEGTIYNFIAGSKMFELTYHEAIYLACRYNFYFEAH